MRPLGIDGVAVRVPHLDRTVVWCGPASASAAASVGYDGGDRVDYVVGHVESVLRSHAAEFVGIQEVRDLVDALEATHPALVAEVLPRQLSLAQVAEVMRRLAHESVSIRDLRAVFEALASSAAQERDPALLAEAVRSRLRRTLTAAVSGGRTSVVVYTLGAATEEAFRSAVQYALPSSPIPIDPAVVETMIDQLRGLESAPRSAAAQRPILLVAQDIRRFVRQTIESELPRLKVYSFQDLTPSTLLHHVATVG